jgi:uncharacterized protein with HEPN domain
MSRHKDALYIHHIQEACRKIIHRLSGVTRAAFDADDEKQDGIIRQLEIIGEAAGQVSEDFRQSHPFIDWRGMKDLRNVLIHGYANVDLDEVWRIAHTHVPELYRQLVALQRESEEEGES